MGGNWVIIFYSSERRVRRGAKRQFRESNKRGAHACAEKKRWSTRRVGKREGISCVNCNLRVPDSNYRRPGRGVGLQFCALSPIADAFLWQWISWTAQCVKETEFLPFLSPLFFQTCGMCQRLGWGKLNAKRKYPFLEMGEHIGCIYTGALFVAAFWIIAVVRTKTEEKSISLDLRRILLRLSLDCSKRLGYNMLTDNLELWIKC